MSFHYAPPKPEDIPVVVGLAGPTKSGKTYSALRLAVGLANGGPVAMINAEGPKGHLYRKKFDYLATDIGSPYRPERYTEAVKDALALKPPPAVLIIDSMTHMHDGPGGMIEYHKSEIDRLAGKNASQKERDKKNWTAWINPKAAENEFLYVALDSGCHLILCFRAKEKLKIVSGREPIALGWRPITSDRVSFETLFTLVLPPHSKGIPDLSISEMREPFDTLIPQGEQLSEETGKRLAEWAKGSEGEPRAERGAASALGSGEAVADSPSPSENGTEPLTLFEFRARMAQEKIPKAALDELGPKLFPDSKLADLSDEERGALFDAVVQRADAVAS